MASGGDDHGMILMVEHFFGFETIDVRGREPVLVEGICWPLNYLWSV